jgi:hypothetical protein
MVLRGVCLFREREIGWLFAPGGGASILNPRGYADFTSTLSEEEVAGGLQGVLGAYARDLMGEDTAARVGLPASQSLIPTPLICCWSGISPKPYTLASNLNSTRLTPHATRHTLQPSPGPGPTLAPNLGPDPGPTLAPNLGPDPEIRPINRTRPPSAGPPGSFPCPALPDSSLEAAIAPQGLGWSSGSRAPAGGWSTDEGLAGRHCHSMMCLLDVKPADYERNIL